MKRRILVVEDDAHLADGLRINLDLEGYEPVLAGSAEDGLELWQRGGVDLILLDVMLPGMDGFAFCRHVRREGDRVPILFLTARGAGQDRIRGLDEGGDDYITKPFDLQELLARIKSHLPPPGLVPRRRRPPRPLRIGRAEVNLRAYQATTADGTVDLKEKEAMILRLLREHAGRTGGPRDHPGPRLGLRRLPHHAHRRQLHPLPAQDHRDGPRARRATS